MHMDYLQIEKYRLALLFFLFFLLFPPEMSLPLLQSAYQHSATQTRISPHIADMARTIKAVLKTFSHLWENRRRKKKKKIETEKIHKQNNNKTGEEKGHSGKILRYKPKDVFVLDGFSAFLRLHSVANNTVVHFLLLLYLSFKYNLF